MSNFGAAAILAVATLAASASAQSTGDCAPQTGIDSRCHGPEATNKKACCPGLVCMQKDMWYGQCKPEGAPVPDGWDGTIVDYSGASSTDDGVAQTPLADAPMSDDYADVGIETPEMKAALMPMGDVKYMAVIAKDYIPNDAVPNMVMVLDLPVEVGGNVVADQKECEDLCTATEGCNLASYYLDASVSDTEGRNCWLKMIMDSCELPGDALDDPNAVLLLQLDETCEMFDAFGPMGAIAEGPGGAMGPESDGMAPRSFDGLDAPATAAPITPSAPVSAITGQVTTPTVDPPSSDARFSMRGAMMAIAVAGALAAF